MGALASGDVQVTRRWSQRSAFRRAPSVQALRRAGSLRSASARTAVSGHPFDVSGRTVGRQWARDRLHGQSERPVLLNEALHAVANT
jgi:hypothetical protein